MNDENLIRLLKSDLSKGISQAIDIYGGMVKTIVTRKLGSNNLQDIEECVSDVFVELWKSLDKYELDKGSLKNYIISITRFVSINKYNRYIKKENTIKLDESFEDYINIENEVYNSINKNIVKDAINSLDYPDKEIFIRRYYLFETVKSIAENLELNMKFVENKLYRSKKTLKEILLDKGIIL